MKAKYLFPSIVFAILVLSSFFSPVSGQDQKRMHRHSQDTTRMKDPMNRMHDSVRMKKMMRDSNFMKNDRMRQDTMPMKRGWMNTDSARKKNRRT
jgi:hypothetical protein